MKTILSLKQLLNSSKVEGFINPQLEQNELQILKDRLCFQTMRTSMTLL